MSKILFLFTVLASFSHAVHSIECTLPSQLLTKENIENLSDNCTQLTGNLMVDGSNSSDISYSLLEEKFSEITAIDGCVLITNTYISSMYFLRNLKTINCKGEGGAKAALEVSWNFVMSTFGIDNISSIEMTSAAPKTYTVSIEANQQLCISEELFWRMNKTGRFNHDVMICNMPANMCYARPAFTQVFHIPSTCDTLISPLVLTNVTKFSTDDQNKLNRIKTIMSYIVLANNSLVNFRMENLESVQVTEYSDQYSAVSIRFNPFLTNIILPKLKEVHRIGSSSVFLIQNNTALGMNDSFCAELYEMGRIECTGNKLDCDPKYSKLGTTLSILGVFIVLIITVCR